MTNGLNRRRFLKGAGAAALLASPLLQWASAQSDKTKKILFFTRSAGFEHDTVQRKNPEKLGFAEQWMVDGGLTERTVRVHHCVSSVLYCARHSGGRR